MENRAPAGFNRRSIISLIALGAGYMAGQRFLAAQALAQAAPNADPDFASLQPGQFIWHPERAPKGPVAIIVSIPKQLTFVYRNGILIGVSTCSTGRPGHSTPAGVFTILQKAKVHTSATYGEPMPDMQRLTWKGIALHVGDLPGYPDSHGCVHLPPDFADDLFAITQIGTPVILAGGHSDPASVADPGAILGTTAKQEIEAKIRGKSIPSFSPDAVMSILVSRADMKIYVLQNADIVAEGAATIKDPAEPIGSNVFVWQGGDVKGSTWDAMGFHADPTGSTTPSTDLLQRIDGAPDVMDVIRDRIKPGTVLVTTDLPASPDTRSGSGFTVMDAPSS
jgi:hypothetical protein